MTDYLEKLNDVQREAVKNIKGPVMIIAGAGSGKTRVLTYRIAYLMQQGVDPFQILSLTFTNKAAREMKSRISGVVGAEAKNLWMGTFHSVFARILRSEAGKIGYPTNFTIYDSEDSKSLIRDILKEQGLDDKIYKPSLVLNRISSAKNNLFNWLDYQENTELVNDDQLSGKPKIGLLFELYSKRCFKAGAMDFDDILYNTFRLLTEHNDALNKYQNKFNYVMVDEFQDTNFAQYLIVKKLSARHENICVVGDDAQSIYAFRGANIQNILNFEKDYPDLKTFKLEQNYRSTKNIVQAANSVISNNRSQLKKEVWTDNDTGNRIKLMRALSDNEEGQMVAQQIFADKMNLYLKNSDFAILYRTNAQSRSMEEALRRQNIPYRVYGGISFYQRKEIKDLLAYFRLAINSQDEEAIKRVINYPKREIGKTSLDRLIVAANEQGLSVWTVMENIHDFNTGINGPTRERILEFVVMVKSWKVMLENYPAYELASHIANASGLLRELYTDRTPEGVSHYDNIQELLNGIKEFSENGAVPLESPSVELNTQSLRTLDLYMQDIALLTDADKGNEADQNKVQLMTIHSAKGLEFNHVFIVGLEENLFPSQLSLNSRSDLEEERRLFYVAITRAEKSLTMSYAASRYRWGNLVTCEPSRFLEEVDPATVEAILPKVKDKELVENWNNYGNQNYQSNRTSKPAPKEKLPVAAVPQGFRKTTVAQVTKSDFKADDSSLIEVGMNVEHEKFGSGKVISMEGKFPDSKALILFDGFGQKQLLLKFAKLKIVS
ncbi:MAG: UvrD-helicase domain-containing protein [Bacteroidota bacterium]